jgi:uncharacterized protein YbaR (Trm112 family)
MPQPPAISAILSMLVCPVCHGSFRVEAENVVCLECGRSYPIRENIPVLIPEQAKILPDQK